jgi:hypothetical protein
LKTIPFRVRFVRMANARGRDGCIRKELAAGGIHPKFDAGPILAKLVVFSPSDLFDDGLCDLIPIDGPVDQPTKFDLVINLTTAPAFETSVP